MKKPNYVLKSALLNTDLPNIVNKYDYQKFLLNKVDIDSDEYFIRDKLLSEMYTLYFGDLDIETQIVFLKECRRINNASYKRKIRLQNRIVSMLDKGKCYFITLTFSDDVLNNTSKSQRRERVREFLKEFYCEYVANIDYGAKNGREHYHAVCLYKKRFDYTKHWYNNVYKSKFDSELIIYNKNAIDKLPMYISKLTNHAIKATTKREALIYSRKK